MLREKGILIKHKRYKYRGVIVEFDLFCKASNEWYSSNQTQPARDQPWYHILVHNTDSITYAAESNLEFDFSGEEITHPLIPMYFSGFKNSRYIRNDQPWVF